MPYNFGINAYSECGLPPCLTRHSHLHAAFIMYYRAAAQRATQRRRQREDEDAEKSRSSAHTIYTLDYIYIYIHQKYFRDVDAPNHTLLHTCCIIHKPHPSAAPTLPANMCRVFTHAMVNYLRLCGVTASFAAANSPTYTREHTHTHARTHSR